MGYCHKITISKFHQNTGAVGSISHKGKKTMRFPMAGVAHTRLAPANRSMAPALAAAAVKHWNKYLQRNKYVECAPKYTPSSGTIDVAI
jgi:hypothetical protein